MLMPDPKVLRSLLARYADLRIAGRRDEETRRALEDVTYTLCVMTATSTIEDAIETADSLLAGAGTEAGVPEATPAVPAPGVPAPSVPAAAAPPVDDGGVTLVA